MIARRTLLAAAAALPAAGAAAQDAWPSRPIRFILPYPPGGAADRLARALADHLREQLGQNVVVESRPGGASMIGALAVAQAPADGYTILYAGWPTVTMNVVMHRSPPYRTEDFQPITPFFRTPLSVAVAPDSPVRNFRDLIEEAKRRGSLSYGTSGVGASSHMLMERVKAATGANFEHVPYRGEMPAATDVVARHTAAYVGSIGTILELHRGGRIRIIGHTNPERLPFLPDIATLGELGFTEAGIFTYWHGALVRAGTPQPIVQRLNAAFVSGMASPAVRSRLPEDLVPFTQTPEEFAALIRDELQTWSPIIRANNMVLE